MLIGGKTCPRCNCPGRERSISSPSQTVQPFLYEIILPLSDPAMMRELLLTGRRLTGKEALDAKIVSAIHPAESLFPKTMELADALSRKDRETYATIKRGMKRRLEEFQKKLQEKQIF